MESLQSRSSPSSEAPSTRRAFMMMRSDSSFLLLREITPTLGAQLTAKDRFQVGGRRGIEYGSWVCGQYMHEIVGQDWASRRLKRRQFAGLHYERMQLDQDREAVELLWLLSDPRTT